MVTYDRAHVIVPQIGNEGMYSVGRSFDVVVVWWLCVLVVCVVVCMVVGSVNEGVHRVGCVCVIVCVVVLCAWWCGSAMCDGVVLGCVVVFGSGMFGGVVVWFCL